MADLKASLCGELPNQESVIPKEQLRNLLERRGIVGDPDIPTSGGLTPRSTTSPASACWCGCWRWTAATEATPE